MQEAGIPVTYGYISDLHEQKSDTRTGCTIPRTPATAGRPLGPGDTCYVTNAQHYDAAFQKFFERLAADGITPANTLFVISSEENDQFAGANVGRATQPTPAGCDGVTTPCNYAAGQIGELQANIKGLLSGTASSSTPVRHRAAGRGDLRARPAGRERPGRPPTRTRHRRDDRRRPLQRRQRREDHRSTRRVRSSSACSTCRRRIRCGRRRTRCSRRATTSSRPRGRTSASTPASPTTTATTARTSTSPGWESPGRASPTTGRRRAAAGRRQPAARSGGDEHRAGGEPDGHMGRGDRHQADDAVPRRPDATTTRSDGHVITQALTSVPARARRDRRPGGGLRPDQLERRPVRNRHADRRHEGARRAARPADDSAYADGASDAASNSPTTAIRRRRRSSRRSECRGGTHAEPRRDPERPLACEGAAVAGAHARIAVAPKRSGGGATRPRTFSGRAPADRNSRQLGGRRGVAPLGVRLHSPRQARCVVQALRARGPDVIDHRGGSSTARRAERAAAYRSSHEATASRSSGCARAQPLRVRGEPAKLAGRADFEVDGQFTLNLCAWFARPGQRRRDDASGGAVGTPEGDRQGDPPASPAPRRTSSTRTGRRAARRRAGIQSIHPRL